MLYKKFSYKTAMKDLGVAHRAVVSCMAIGGAPKMDIIKALKVVEDDVLLRGIREDKAAVLLELIQDIDNAENIKDLAIILGDMIWEPSRFDDPEIIVLKLATDLDVVQHLLLGYMVAASVSLIRQINDARYQEVANNE